MEVQRDPHDSPLFNHVIRDLWLKRNPGRAAPWGPRRIYSEIVSDIKTGRRLKEVVLDQDYRGEMAEAMARQYFNSQSADSIIAAIATTPTTTKTALFSPAQANVAFPIGYGQNAPFAGQVYSFAFGGIITTPATGTLIIDPYFGPGTSTTVFGTDLGASAAQTVTASLSSAPFYCEGQIAFRSISGTATSSTAWLTGTFSSQGTLATAGGGWGIVFGSTAAVSVDTTGTGSAGTFGALNFAVTFSVTGATVTAEWSSMQSMN